MSGPAIWRSWLAGVTLALCCAMQAFAWQAAVELRIPAAERDPVTFGGPNCPIVLVGGDAWHLKQGRLIRSIEVEYNARALRSLSTNGRYFAYASKSPNQQSTDVAIWDIVQQKEVAVIPGDPEKFVDVLEFAGPKTLLLGGRHSTELVIVDAETATVTKTLKTPVRRVSGDNFAVSPDGEHFAVMGDDTVLVCSLANGKRVAALSMPGAGQKPPSPAKDPEAFRAALKAGLGTRFTLAWMKGLCFSPDGQEIAAVSTHPHAHLMAWNARGKLIYDEALSAVKIGIGDLQLRWLPDGSGWLVNGNLVDREMRQPVLCWNVPFAQDFVALPLDRSRILGRFGDTANLTVFEIPWEPIKKSHEAMNSGGPAYLAPKQPLSVRIEIANARGNVQETQRLLLEAITTRLERIGIPVKAGSETTLVLRLVEREGDRLPIFERQSRFDFRGVNTGKTAAEAKGDVLIELIAAGQAQPVWRDTLQGFSSNSFNENITDETVRKSMLENLSRALVNLPMPYYLPKQNDLLALPALIP